jgi:hypothetical protein
LMKTENGDGRVLAVDKRGGKTKPEKWKLL